MATSLNTLWVLLCAALVMSMQIGFCMLEAGLVRSKNSINVAIKNLIDFCVAAILFWAFGFGLMFGDTASGWLGTSSFLLPANTEPSALTFFIFQLMFCATAATIVSGAVAERMSFSAYIFVTMIVSGIIYPIGGGWAWNDHGWLREMGFRDFAGSSVVHSVGGWVSLAAVLILKPRTGRFDTKVALVSSHSLVISTVGVLVLFVGWLGFNGGSTLALNAQVPAVLMNTTLAGAAGCLAALAAVWWHKKLPELPPTLNGCVGGLVAITACCNVVTPAESILIGAIGGVLSYVAVILLEMARIDDVVGASAAHGIPGMWGTLCVGFFGNPAILATDLSRGAQIGIQSLGVATYFVWAFGMGFLLLSALNFLHRLRIRPEFEQVGLNVAEHGASTEIIDLINEMARHSYKGEFNERLSFEPFTEVGQIASQYNRVIDKVLAEMELRENIARHLERARDESESANRKIFSSLQYARRIQHAMLPPPVQLRATLGDHFVVYEPRDLVSGDFYWCATTPNGRYCAVVDCTGHGVPGAFMSMIGYLLLERVVVEKQIAEPATILSDMHRRVRQALAQDSSEGAGNRDGMEIALVRITENEIAFAGAQRPMWWFAKSAEDAFEFGEILGDRHGLGGGTMEPQEIEFTQHVLPRRDGLTIYLQSDGLVQQPNHLRAIYDRGRLRDLLQTLQTAAISTHARHILASFQEFRGGATQRDDVTILGFRPWGESSLATPPSVSSTPSRAQTTPDTLFTHTGPVNAATIAASGATLRERLPLTASEQVTVFGMFMEIAQNVARHSSERDENGGGIGTIFASDDGEILRIGSRNQVTREEARALKQRWDALEGADAEALRKLFLSRLHETQTLSSNRGLGLIDLARKSLDFPEVHLDSLDSDKIQFSITVTVKHTPSRDGR